MRKYIKRQQLVFFSIPFLFLFSCLIPVQAADNFTITVKENGKLQGNGELIFHETNIGPGFSKTYQIDVINNYKEEIHLYLDKIYATSNIDTMEEYSLTMSGGNYQISTGVSDFQPQESSFLDLQSKTNTVFNLTVALDREAGNIYQNSQTEFTFVFRVEYDDKDSGTSQDGDKDSKPSGVVTGDKTPILIWGLFLITSIMAMIYLWSQRYERLKHERRK